MRNKIIAVNAIIVLVVGLLAWVLMQQKISAAASNPAVLLAEAKYDVQGASSRLQLDALRAEHWLATRTADPAILDAFQKSTVGARKEAATTICDRTLSDARGSAVFEGIAPAMAMLIDEKGQLIGRNGSSLNYGRDLSADYAAFKDALAKGIAGSDIWANKDRQDSFLASYVPVRGPDGHVAGMIALGVGLADELVRVSEQTTGRPLALVSQDKVGGEMSVVAHSTNTELLAEAALGPAKDLVKRALDGGKTDAVQVTNDMLVGASLLDGLGEGKRVALVASFPGALLNANGMASPILYLTGLGVFFVILGGWMLGNYITRPINLLEEGLLAILNGQQDKRFELDHPELGGLAFRIDQLLNQLMGIEEDTTDDQGRPSKAPSAADFREAMSVDRGGGGDSQVDPAVVQALAAEPAAQYYARIYREYISAKKSLGEQTDHITEQAFATRIQGMEGDAAQKYGRPVRYQVHARNKEVVLLAVPLPG